MPPCVCVCVCGMWEKREKVTKRYERRSPHVFMCRLRARERTKKSQDEQERLSKLPIFFSFFLFLKRCDCKEETFFFFLDFEKLLHMAWRSWCVRLYCFNLATFTSCSRDSIWFFFLYFTFFLCPRNSWPWTERYTGIPPSGNTVSVTNFRFSQTHTHTLTHTRESIAFWEHLTKDCERGMFSRILGNDKRNFWTLKIRILPSV